MSERLAETPPSAPTRGRRKRVWVLAITLLFALALYLAPQLPPLRARLLGAAERAAENAGYDLRYARDAGNPWSGLRLEEAELSGAGLELSVDTFDVGYFLPALLTGELPLSFAADGVRGELTLAELELPSGGGGLPFRPVLRDLELSDVNVRVDDLPFLLPDFSLDELQARSGAPERLSTHARLSTAEGEAELEANVELSPLRVTGRVLSADLGIVRQWWSGMEGGELSGSFAYENGELSAQAEVEQGQLSFLGETLGQLRGTVLYEHPRVSADLSGEALGGTLDVSGGVAIDERRWFGEASGRVDLRDTALWLAENRLPFSLEEVPLGGAADVQLRASGWREVQLSGLGVGAGSVAGYALEDLAVDFGFTSGEGTRVTATGELAGGTLSAQLRPTPGGFGFALDAQDVALLEGLKADLAVDLNQDGALLGQTRAAVSGQLLGDPVQVTLDGQLGPDGLRLPVSGEVLSGALGGSLDLIEGRLEADIRAQDLELPLLNGPVDARVQASGPVARLPLSLRLEPAEDTRLSLGGLTLTNDLTGALSARLEGTRLEAVEGAFGPLAFTGSVAPGEGALSYTLSDASLEGPVESELRRLDGTIDLQEGALEGAATLSSSALRLPGATLPPLEAELAYRYRNNLSLTLADVAEGLRLSYEAGALELNLTDTPVSVAGQTLRVSGEGASDAGAPLDSLNFDLRGETPFGAVALGGDADEAIFELSSLDGGAAGLNVPTSVKGSLRLREGTAQFAGRLGDLDLSGSGSLGERLRAELFVRSLGETLRLDVSGTPGAPQLALSGGLPAAPLGEVVGVALGGRVNADLQRDAGGYSGAADFTGAVASVPVQLELRGVGAGLELSGEAEPLGLSVGLGGSLLPELRLSASSAYGDLLFQRGELSGGGTLPELALAGFELGAQPWQLSGSTGASQISVTLPEADSAAQLDWSEGWQLTGELHPSLHRAESRVRLNAALSASAAQPTGDLRGVLHLDTPNADGNGDFSATLDLSGSLDELRLSGAVPAAVLTSLVQSPAPLQGEVSLNARADLLDGPSYDAALVWDTPLNRLTGDLIGTGGEATLRATAEGLELRYSGGGVSVEADDFDPGGFVALPSLRGRLNGALTRAPGSWDGRLELTTNAPVEAELSVSGAGSALELAASAEQGPASARVQGRVLPELALDVSGDVMNVAALEGSLTGPVTEASLRAQLITEPVTLSGALTLDLPALELVLEGDLTGGPELQLKGDGVDVLWRPAGFSGGLELPFQLQDQAHRLRAEFVGDEGTGPALIGELSGPLVEGPLRFADETLDAALTLDPAPWTGNQLEDAALGLELRADTSLGWRASANGSAELRGVPADLQTELRGQGLDYEGGGTLRLADSPVPFNLEGEGGAARLTAQLDSVELAPLSAALPTTLPTALTGQLSGTVHLDTAAETPLRYALEAAGEVGGQTFTLSATDEGAAPLRAQLSLAGFGVDIEQVGTDYRFDISGAAGAQQADLAGLLELTPEPSLSANGQLGTTPLALEARYEPGRGQGGALVEYGEARLTLGAEQEAGGWRFDAQLSAPERAELPLVAEAELQAKLQNGALTLERFQAQSQLAERSLDLSLSGPAWPDPQLAGQLGVSGYDPFALTLRGNEGYTLGLAQNGLELSAQLSPALRPLGAALRGSGPLPLGDLRLEADLTWQAADGFGGSAALTGGVADAVTALDLSGEGDLRINGTARYRSLASADLALRLGPELLNDPALSGSVQLQGEVAAQGAAGNGERLSFEAPLELSGRVSDPSLSGPVDVKGAVEAAGTVRWSAGEGRLDLTGDSLSAVATLGAAGWQLEAEADALDVGPLAPQLDAPRLSATIDAEARWGETVRLVTDGLSLRTPNSEVTGRLRYADGLRGRLETRFDLRDLRLGPALEGEVSGRLSVGTGTDGAPLLGGTLEVSNVSAPTALEEARLDGNVSISGSPLAPYLTAQLRGSGTADGRLFAAFKADENRFELNSDLAVAGLVSDLQLSTEGEGLRAEGSLRYGDYALQFVDAPSPSGLRLEGQDKLAGWHVEADTATRTAALSGTLATLNPALSGELQLRADAGADTWVTGELRGVAAGPVDLGDIALRPAESLAAARTLRLEGERLAASVQLGGNLDWTLERLDLALPGELTASLGGSGTRSSAELSGQLAGELLGAATALPIDLSYRDGALNADALGPLLDGTLTLELAATADNGWTGDLELIGAQYSGLALDLKGTVEGPFGAPQLDGSFVASGPEAALQGTLTASSESAELTGELNAPRLDELLEVEGALWPETALRLGTSSQSLRLGLEDGLLVADGQIDLGLQVGASPLELALSAEPDALLSLTLRSDAAPGLALRTALPQVPPGDLTAVLEQGLRFEGVGATEGAATLRLADGLELALDELSWSSAAGTAVLGGSLEQTPGGFTGELQGNWQRGREPDPRLPWLASLASLGAAAKLGPDGLAATLQGDALQAELRFDPQSGRGNIDALWQLPEGSAQVDLELSPETGLNGAVTTQAFPLFSSEASGAARLDARLNADAGLVTLEATTRLDGGEVALRGKLGLAGLAPAILAPQGRSERQLEASFDAFDLGTVPWLARYTPFLDAPLSGTLSLLPTPSSEDTGETQAGVQEGSAFAPGEPHLALRGILSSPQLRVGERRLPLEVALRGRLEPLELELEGKLERSRFELKLNPEALAGLVRFEYFPLDSFFEASAGPTDVEARLTGALRFDVPRGKLAESYVRFASEQLSVERNGERTEGDLSFELEDQDLVIGQARFEGAGSWQASGEASRERLNLRIDAQDADFGPLLALVPQLAGLEAGARGSLQLVSSGSLVNPIIRAASPGIELALAGSAYTLDDVSLTVQNNDFVTSGRLAGVAPLSGSLGFSGGGQLLLAPERSFDLDLRFAGDLDVPVLGTVENIDGAVTARPGEPWRLDSSGELDQPYRLEGSLTPLDLRLNGSGLNVKAPQFLLASSSTDVNMRFAWDAGLNVSGSLLTRRAQLDLEGREPADDSGTEARDPRRGAALSRVFFRDISLRAPQQVSFSENFGSGELGNIDLTLGGTAAQPYLNGSAEALRGTVRFAGRDFSLDEALASFEPAQGVFPSLDITASSSFNKTQVTRGLGTDIEFAEPTGPDFRLQLELVGAIEPDPSGERAFEVNITPQLSSDAVISEAGTAGARSLSEAELFSLLSLGRLELSPQFASSSGVATSLAEGAINTAVDFLILSEIQRELGSALGLDLVEIRTTPLSSLITGEEEDFGVSLRIGGYLSDEVFASYRIGSIGLADGVALSNEFNLRYTLAPLEFSLGGTLDFRNDGSAVPALDLGVSYALSPVVGLETGGELSAINQSVRFGVSFRW